MDILSHESHWLQTQGESIPSFPTLDTDRRADVVVIGAGITGLTAALHLKQAGKLVAIVEAGRIGAGTTSGTSGHLDVMPDQGFAKLDRDFGEAGARKATAARVQAIDQIENWVRQFGIECDFRRVSALAYTERADRADHIHAEYEAAHRLGLDVVVKADAGLPFSTAAALEIRDQARFHVLKYLRGLVQAVQGGTASIYESTRAEPPEDGDPCAVRANGHELAAMDVIVATHSSYLGISQFDMRQAAYQSYVLAVRVDEDIPDALYWDDERPYHYIRLASSDDPRLLIIGGADHKTGEGNEVEHVRQLRDYVCRRFAIAGVEQQWSSEFFEPSDGLPMIGRVPFTEHLYIATGFSGTGLTYGTAAGKILANQILGRTSPCGDVFSPSRFKPLAAAKDFISENLNAAKHFVADRFSSEHLTSLDMVKAGEGCIVQLNGEKFAVYRDEQNQLHQLSPVCTHAGCYVQWNSLEKTWDCPCHGGRYSATGQRIYGPPPADLKRNVPLAID